MPSSAGSAAADALFDRLRTRRVITGWRPRTKIGLDLARMQVRWRRSVLAAMMTMALLLRGSPSLVRQPAHRATRRLQRLPGHLSQAACGTTTARPEISPACSLRYASSASAAPISADSIRSHTPSICQQANSAYTATTASTGPECPATDTPPAPGNAHRRPSPAADTGAGGPRRVDGGSNGTNSPLGIGQIVTGRDTVDTKPPAVACLP
jgi:hypothetical protein